MGSNTNRGSINKSLTRQLLLSYISPLSLPFSSGGKLSFSVLAIGVIVSKVHVTRCTLPFVESISKVRDTGNLDSSCSVDTSYNFLS